MEINEFFCITATQDDCLLIDVDYTYNAERIRTLYAYRASDLHGPLTPLITQWLADHPDVEILPYVEPEPVSEPVPDEISRRQFFQQLSAMEIITKPEALSALTSGSIPAPLQSIIDQLPTEDDQFNAQMLVIGAQTFNRTHPLAEIVRQAMQWTVEQKDDFWREAAKL